MANIIERNWNKCVVGSKLIWYKLFLGDIKISLSSCIDSSVAFSFRKGCSVWIERGANIAKKCSIKVRKGARLYIGKGVGINSGCIIVAHDNISIGTNTIIAQNVLFFDHDHILSADKKKENNSYKTEPIIIGNNCWIGAGCIILRGTSIGNNCIIGAGSVVKGIVPANSKFYQKRLNNIIKIAGV
ncbi:MAG: acyltransferase [Acidaminococcaceae bacterium]